MGVCVLTAGCAHPLAGEIELYMCADPEYARLPRGPERVDALWIRAKEVAGSEVGALRLLGSLAVREGLRLSHPYSTGLTPKGDLAPNDKTGHFFSHAMWYYFDRYRPIPVARINGIGWEIVGEIRSWFGRGRGFNWRDVWANRLGREFARRLHAKHGEVSNDLLPSDIIAQAEAFRPTELAPRSTSDATTERPEPQASACAVRHRPDTLSVSDTPATVPVSGTPRGLKP